MACILNTVDMLQHVDLITDLEIISCLHEHLHDINNVIMMQTRMRVEHTTCMRIAGCSIKVDLGQQSVWLVTVSVCDLLPVSDPQHRRHHHHQQHDECDECTGSI